jgi:protein-S-isoprenylcysteine O-methyltransferase Ste14
MLSPVMRLFLIFGAYPLALALGYLGIATCKQNLIGWFLIIFASAYILGGPFLLYTYKKENAISRQESGDRSFWLILPGFLLVFYAPPLEYLFIPLVIPRIVGLQITGLVLILTSMLLHGWARLALRGMYTGHVQVQVDRPLVQWGPYRVIRHPAYAGYIIMALGMAIGYSSVIGLAGIPLLLLPGLVLRIKVEEKLLAEEYGEEFYLYAQRTKRLIPGVW